MIGLRFLGDDTRTRHDIIEEAMEIMSFDISGEKKYILPALKSDQRTERV